MRRFFTNFFVKSRKFFIRIRRKDDIMEKAPSEYAKYWTSPYAEVNHFYFHAYDIGITRIVEYSSKAIDFLNRNGESVISFRTTSEKFYSTYKYDTETNEFMIISRNGKIVTYYKPEDGIDYFYSKFDEYGNFWL